MTALVRIDMHLHTGSSPDSALTVWAAVEAAAAAGLDGIAVTDHNTMAAIPAAQAAAHRKGLLLIPGVEVSTVEGHLLVYGVVSPPAARRPMAATIREVHAAGGVAVVAHPFRYFHGAGPLARSAGAGADGMETRNGHTRPHGNDLAAELAASLCVPTTGGSDAHHAPDVGRCFTEFRVRSEDAQKLFREGRPVARGTSLPVGERARLGAGNAGQRIMRGLRPI